MSPRLYEPVTFYYCTPQRLCWVPHFLPLLPSWQFHPPSLPSAFVSGPPSFTCHPRAWAASRPETPWLWVSLHRFPLCPAPQLHLSAPCPPVKPRPRHLQPSPPLDPGPPHRWTLPPSLTTILCCRALCSPCSFTRSSALTGLLSLLSRSPATLISDCPSAPLLSLHRQPQPRCCVPSVPLSASHVCPVSVSP